MQNAKCKNPQERKDSHKSESHWLKIVFKDTDVKVDLDFSANQMTCL